MDYLLNWRKILGGLSEIVLNLNITFRTDLIGENGFFKEKVNLSLFLNSEKNIGY